MFTYSHANTPLGQSERAYYLSYFTITSPYVIQIEQTYHIWQQTNDYQGKLLSPLSFAETTGIRESCKRPWCDSGH